MSDALTYLDTQIEEIKTHLAAAVESFDVKSVHQARVATRRLKAGLELLEPLTPAATVKPLARAGKRIRRRLGPLRDLDVMIESLSTMKLPAQSAIAIEWVREQLEKERRDARVDDYEHGKKPTKLLDPLDEWWRVRHKLECEHEAIDLLIKQALHDRFDTFRKEADWVSGAATPPEDHGPIDVHQLRIAGKALRYTLELADAHGLDVPKGVLKKFKSMQESLGEWHDMVVLVETTLSELTEHELPLHAPELAGDVLDVCKMFIRLANKALGRFKTQWNADGAEIEKALHTAAPLTADVAHHEGDIEPLPVEVDEEEIVPAVNGSETDHGRPVTLEIQPPASVGGGSDSTDPT